MPKVNVTDLNKDGLNDLVFVLNKPDATPGFKALVFINQIYPIYSQEPQEYSIVDYEEGHNPYLLQATTADIYGRQEHDGGGIALLTSYLVSDGVGGSEELYIKVLNANEQLQQVAPPPPIVQKSLEYDHDNIWHPHLHLNNRGERDFDYYEIWKYKVGWNEPIKYDWPVRGTGWTNIYECVDASGQDNFFWNCYYFAKSVDNAPTPNVSIPSQIAYFTVGCVPVCDGCGEEDNPFPSTNQNHSIDAVNKTSLLSNYPNPFNPSTSIRFVLPKEAIVKITIYNCMGQVVKQLVNTRYKAGMHSVRFDGGNLASGIYYCLFETGDYRHTNKMLLIN